MFTVEQFVRIVNHVVRYSCHNQISIIFHGGEPLLAPTSFYRECFDYAVKTFAAAGKTVDFGLQSNLILLQDDMIPLLRQYKVGISTSIDGFQEVHDQARGDWEKTITNLMKLRNGGVRVNFISVCSQHNHHHLAELFRLAKQFGFKSLQLNIATCVNSINSKSTYLPLSEQDILDVYKQSLRLWAETSVIEKNMALMLRKYLSPEWDCQHELYCESPFCYAGFSMLVFTPDNKIHLCSPSVPLTIQHPDFIAGDMDNLTDDLRYTSALRAFHEKDEKYYRECQNCDASRICNFGCPAFDRIDPITAEARCGAIKRFYEFLGSQDQDVLKQLISNSHELNTY